MAEHKALSADKDACEQAFAEALRIADVAIASGEWSNNRDAVAVGSPGPAVWVLPEDMRDFLAILRNAQTQVAALVSRAESIAVTLEGLQGQNSDRRPLAAKRRPAAPVPGAHRHYR